jgi:hypothetical protein
MDRDITEMKSKVDQKLISEKQKLEKESQE